MSLIRSVSPTAPSDVVVECAEVEPARVLEIVERAKRAQREYVSLPPAARADGLNAAAEALAARSAEVTELAIREVGKPRLEMEGETARGVSILRYYAQAVLDPDGTSLPAATGLMIARRRPHGVAALITPWNFPVAIPLWKAAPALAYGNAVVCKPAPAATAVALLLEEILRPHLPEGVFTVVPGDQITGSALIASADAVSFTGSVRVGRQVVDAAARRGIPVQAEMGGQNASIVLPDADFPRAARMVAAAAMGFSGQKCTATSRVVLVGKGDEFIEALVAEIAKLERGDPAARSTVIGPVVSEAARVAVVEAAREARRTGGVVISGGAAIDGDGYFVEPTLIDGIDPASRLAQEEIFGPVATVLRVKNLDEAVAVANGVRYGLVSSVFTGDLNAALAISERLETGLVRTNAPTSGVDFYAPFGGVKESSYGPREQGKAAADFYTWTQTLSLNP